MIDAKGFYIETKVESEKIKTPDYMNTIQKETRPYICFGFNTNQLCCVYADNTKPAGVDIECLISDSNKNKKPSLSSRIWKVIELFYYTIIILI